MKALTFKEKQDVLEDLFKKYHRAVLQLKCLEERNFYPAIQFDTVKEKKTYYQDKGSQLNDQLVLKEELEKVIATFEFILDCGEFFGICSKGFYSFFAGDCLKCAD